MKKLKFRQKLFLYYSAIVFLVILLGFGAVYAYIVKRLQTEILQNMELSVKEMTGQLDNRIKEMDRLTIEVVSNPFIQEYMQNLSKEGIPNSYSDMGNMASNTLISISAVNLGSLRVSIFNRFGSYISIGIPDDQKAIGARMKMPNYTEWYDSVIPKRNSSGKLPPHDDFWADKEKMISVIREIVDINSYASYGLVEIQYPVRKLEELFFGGQLISCIEGEKGIVKTSLNGEKSYFCYEKSENTDWYFAVVKPVNVLQEAVFPVVGVALLIAIVLLLVMLVFTGLIADRLTKPLKKLQERIRHADRAQTEKMLAEEAEERDEIRVIDTAFESLYKNLQLSKDELDYVKLQEAKTRMLAVQAQMNPHFLYNILSVINAIGFEYGADEIMDICQHLSSMLRYAGAFNMNKVSMEEEINHTRNYLELMKCRFKERIRYEIRAEEGTEKIRVPKLILQPIVENCFQHGLREIKTEWKIVIEIKEAENHWFVKVSDNGRGFGREAMEKLDEKLENWQDNLSDDIGSLGIGGYGLINVIIRLKIAYGKKAFFKIHDKGEDGEYCTVEIGGEMNV